MVIFMAPDVIFPQSFDKALRKAEEVEMMTRKLCENKNARIFLQGIF